MAVDMALNDALLPLIRTIADFPRPGVAFKDLTPLLRDPAGLQLTVQRLVAPVRDLGVTVVAGIEARGFVFGALAAQALAVGFVPLRKPGKLPARVASVSYELEYGAATLEIHADALEPGDRVLIVDDVLATGGTAAAGVALVERLGAAVAGLTVVIELAALGGRERLRDYATYSVLRL
jgi:adenine phosphoribosyltransferase